MSINNIKGTLYDLLGYFAPGFIGLAGGYIITLEANNVPDLYAEITETIGNISAFEVFILIIAAYILGHAVASFSSWLIEKILIEKIKRLKQAVAVNHILGDADYNVFCKKYKYIFGVDYSDKSLRKVICFVQAKQPLVYDTALVFLSFYGMARNLSLVFGVFSLIEARACFLGQGVFCVLALLLLLFVVFFYEYIRFRKYFLDTILSAFFIPEKETQREKD